VDPGEKSITAADHQSAILQKDIDLPLLATSAPGQGLQSVVVEEVGMGVDSIHLPRHLPHPGRSSVVHDHAQETIALTDLTHTRSTPVHLMEDAAALMPATRKQEWMAYVGTRLSLFEEYEEDLLLGLKGVGFSIIFRCFIKSLKKSCSE